MEYDGIKDTNFILDAIYDALPETDFGVSLYSAPEGSDDDELYVTHGGMCYRVTVMPHPHPDHEIPEWYYCNNSNCHGHNVQNGINVTCPKEESK